MGLQKDGVKCTRCGATDRLLVRRLNRAPSDPDAENLETICRVLRGAGTRKLEGR